MRCSTLFLLFEISVLVLCDDHKHPTVTIAILARNKQESLQLFLNLLNQMDYPQEFITLWIYSDYNNDESLKIIEEWSVKHSSEYRKIYLTLDRSTNGQTFSDQTHHTEWTPERYRHIINLKEKALQLAKDSWADYIFILDADVFLTNPGTLKELVKKNRQVVAPMLMTDGLYSNFWSGMTKDYYYKRTDNYEKLIGRKEIGCFVVPMVHSAVLISLRLKNTDRLTYDPEKIEDYNGPHDDIITFALSAKKNDVNLTVCNDEIYGFLPIPVEYELNTEEDQVDNVKLEALGRGIDLPIDPSLKKFIYFPQKSKYGLDEVYLINLERRKERKNLMMKSFDTLGLDVKVVKAVDGKQLTDEKLRDYSVTLMPNYEDPYHKRPIKKGEVGCFLSHYSIWMDIAKRNLGMSLVLEDDIHFVPYFKERFETLMSELETLDWEFVYIGRKVLLDRDEEYVSDHVTKPLYSYWTLGYLISEGGARKLIKAEPLAKMLPVDEFLPILFNQHPNNTWKSMFPNRDLKAFSAAPLLVQPTHYTGEKGYISDTEDSAAVTHDYAKLGTPDFNNRHFHEL